MVSLDTDCMMAETSGIFMVRDGVSPLRYLTMAVFRLTLAGMHSAEEYPGTSRYSPKVRLGSL